MDDDRDPVGEPLFGAIDALARHDASRPGQDDHTLVERAFSAAKPSRKAVKPAVVRGGVLALAAAAAIVVVALPAAPSPRGAASLRDLGFPWSEPGEDYGSLIAFGEDETIMAGEGDGFEAAIRDYVEAMMGDSASWMAEAYLDPLATP